VRAFSNWRSESKANVARMSAATCGETYSSRNQNPGYRSPHPGYGSDKKAIDAVFVFGLLQGPAGR
jgi:hypothetical protein